jgi:hypothetical protein
MEHQLHLKKMPDFNDLVNFHFKKYHLILIRGRAVAQAVSRWLPTAAARFVVDKAALGQVFSKYFGFPCQLFHKFLHHHNCPGLAQ